jgi:hypothetical protein
MRGVQQASSPMYTVLCGPVVYDSELQSWYTAPAGQFQILTKAVTVRVVLSV